MAHQITGRFTNYSFTEEERKEAVKFSPLQQMYLQNLLGEKAHEKIGLTFNAADVVGFAQNEAYLAGQIELLELLLSQEAIANAAPSQE